MGRCDMRHVHQIAIDTPKISSYSHSISASYKQVQRSK
jgi:hypothetical protein